MNKGVSPCGGTAAGEWEHSTKTGEEYCGCLLMPFVMIHCG